MHPTLEVVRRVNEVNRVDVMLDTELRPAVEGRGFGTSIPRGEGKRA